MFNYLLRRLLSSVIVLFIVVTITFFMIQLAPGGLSILMRPDITAEEAARLARNLGLDRPPHVQYFNWLRNVLTGDFGQSLAYGGRSVLEMVVERLPATLYLGLSAMLLTLVLGIPTGIIAARNQNNAIDQVLSFFSFLGLATPNFWLGIMLIVLFSVELNWLPASGIRSSGDELSFWNRLKHLVMPAVVLGTSSVATIVRYTRSSWLETMRLDYVLVARSKGLSRRHIDYKHILRNAIIPVITVFGIALPRIVGGAAVVETLFSWPGLGKLAVDAALRRDTPLILGVTIFISAAVILSNLLVDTLYPVLDPRIRYE
ncbi:MAG: ABC transporter permease [Deinococcota bacterium]